MIRPLALAALLVCSSERTALEDVRLTPAPDAPRVTVLVEDGRIAAVLAADAPLPPGYRSVAGLGRLALPAFVDAYTHAGCETPEPVADRDLATDTSADVDVAMRAANRKGMQPAFRAVDVLNLREKTAESWRAQGFGALVSAPHGQLLSGISTLATTGDAARRDAVIVSELFTHAALTASGPGYPSTLMGYMAQLRQFFLDASLQVELVRRAGGRSGARPPYDPELEVGASILGGARLFCEADSASDILRWLALGDEFGFAVGITGGREAWKVADELAARGVPVILTLDWGKEVPDPDKEKGKGKDKDKDKGARKEAAAPESEETPPRSGDAEAAETIQDTAPDADAPESAPASSESPSEPGEAPEGEAPEGEAGAESDEPDWLYTEPKAVRAERRRLWVEGRDCALALARSGVRFAFGSGAEDAKKLVEHVRELVEAGLERDAALAALTTGAAEITGIGASLGAVEVGRDATFALWTEDPLGAQAKKAKLAGIFVDGRWYEFDVEAEKPDAEGAPGEGIDASGTWKVEYEAQGQAREVTFELTMDADGQVTGTFAQEGFDGSPLSGSVAGHVAGSTLTLSGQYTVSDMTVDFELEGELEGDALDGTMSAEGPFGSFEMEASGTRTAPPERRGRERNDASGSGRERPHLPDDCCNPATAEDLR